MEHLYPWWHNVPNLGIFPTARALVKVVRRVQFFNLHRSIARFAGKLRKLALVHVVRLAAFQTVSRYKTAYSTLDYLSFCSTTRRQLCADKLDRHHLLQASTFGGLSSVSIQHEAISGQVTHSLLSDWRTVFGLV